MQTYTLIGRLGVVCLGQMVTWLLIHASGGATVGFPFPLHDLSGQYHEGAGGCKGGRQSVTGPMGATNLADGAHGPHVALVSRAEFRWSQQPCRVQAVQTSIDGNLTHRPQIAVTPNL